jgi:DNA-binding NtrC family response regulator
MKPNLLIIDDEPDFLNVLESYFGFEDYAVKTAVSAEKGLELIGQIQFDAVITDMAMNPGMSGLDLLREIRRTDAVLPVIVMTGVGTIESAVEAIQQGAYHYVTKPFDPKDLEILARRAVESGRMHRSLAQAASEREKDNDWVVGTTPQITDILRTIDKIADSDASVLILGETGTGKTMIARHLHEKSQRKSAPFLTIDCAALTETILESELFGHVKGAFTGAIVAKRGLLEEADGGTIFMDEIGELPPGTQVKLLRAVQELEIKPVGGNRPIKINVRFISATSRNLDDEIGSDQFRKDLYFRLAVIPIKMPALRERSDDLPLFASHFIKKYNKRYNKKVTRLETGLLRMLSELPWKGNIRELENALERAVLLSEGETITRDLFGFPTVHPDYAVPYNKDATLKEIMEEVEKETIRKVLEDTNGNRTAAAKKLGIGRRTLYDKITAYDLQ